MPVNGIPSITEVMKTVSAAEHSHFAALPGAKVADAAAFTAMKAHITGLYKNVEVKHSFVDENGSVFDCIPVSQQPALKGAAPAEAPSMPPVTHGALPGAVSPGERKVNSVTSFAAAGAKDKFGNAQSCPAGCIPMRRITLEEMTRFETLRHFFQKSPLGGGAPPTSAESAAPGFAPRVAATHRWAHAYQNVNNLGGHSYLNVWDPPIGANQIFSLSQHWYVAGSGSKLQTAEVGWQVYPGKYGSTKPVFFIYWTADDYTNTGCYNLDCSAFVQTSNQWTIGGTMSPSSTYGGSSV